MSKDSQVMYDLLLKPLRFNPELTESVILGLKFTLGAMFEDAFAVRDVIVAVREVVDNIAAHADWKQSPGPSLFVRYRAQRGSPQLCVSSVNAVKDIEEAERAVQFIHEHLSNKSSSLLYRELTTRLIDSANVQSAGGIGLLQVASSPRCSLDVRLEQGLFHVRVDVNVPELTAPATLAPSKTGS